MLTAALLTHRTEGHHHAYRTVEAEAAEPGAESWIGPPQFVITTQLERLLLEAEDCWGFDAFQMSEACSNQALSVLTFHLIKVRGYKKLLPGLDLQAIIPAHCQQCVPAVVS